MSGQPFHEIATLQVGEFQADYCPRCHHMDLQRGDILAVTPDGVQRVGGLAVCAECGYSPHAQEAEAREREVPNRDHLVGQRVRLTLNPWASSGPTEGVFNGQGERGLSIVVEGGGRVAYSHHEVSQVTLA